MCQKPPWSLVILLAQELENGNHAQKWGQICWKVFNCQEFHSYRNVYLSNWYFSKPSNFKDETQHYVVKLPKSAGARHYYWPKILRVPGTHGTRANSSPATIIFQIPLLENLYILHISLTVQFLIYLFFSKFAWEDIFLDWIAHFVALKWTVVHFDNRWRCNRFCGKVTISAFLVKWST